jgi:hypothetical protein
VLSVGSLFPYSHGQASKRASGRGSRGQDTVGDERNRNGREYKIKRSGRGRLPAPGRRGRKWRADSGQWTVDSGQWTDTGCAGWRHGRVTSGALAHLEQEDSTKSTEDGARLVVDCMNAHNVDSGTEGDEDHSRDWLKQVEFVAHLKRELCVEEGDRYGYGN